MEETELEKGMKSTEKGKYVAEYKKYLLFKPTITTMSCGIQKLHRNKIHGNQSTKDRKG